MGRNSLFAKTQNSLPGHKKINFFQKPIDKLPKACYNKDTKEMEVLIMENTNKNIKPCGNCATCPLGWICLECEVPAEQAEQIKEAVMNSLQKNA